MKKEKVVATKAQPTVRQTNTLAIVSFVLAIVSIFTSAGLLGIVSLILGYMAQSQIRKTHEEGAGYAKAAIIISIIEIVLGILVVLSILGCVGLSFLPICCIAPFSSTGSN